MDRRFSFDTSCVLGGRGAMWALVSLLLISGSGPALAVPVVSLFWRTEGATSTNIVVSGVLEEEIVADVVLMLDAGDDSRGVFLSLIWDEDGQDELDLIRFVRGQPTPAPRPRPPPSPSLGSPASASRPALAAPVLFSENIFRIPKIWKIPFSQKCVCSKNKIFCLRLF